MSFGSKKIQLLLFVLTVFAFQTVLSSVEDLASALTTLKTKLITLREILEPFKAKPETKDPAPEKQPPSAEELEKLYNPETIVDNKKGALFSNLEIFLSRKILTQENFNIAQSNIKKQIAELARNLDTQAKNFELSKYLLDKIQDQEAISHGLNWCLCTSAPAFLRTEFLLRQLKEIIKIYPDKEKLFTHTEFAEFGCAQLYYLICGLLKSGYRKIHLNLIGETMGLEGHSIALKEALETEREELGIAKEAVSISINVFEGTDWKGNVKKSIDDNPNIFACQSYSMVDPYDAFDRKAIKEFYKLIMLIENKNPHKNPLIFALVNNKVWGTQTPDQLILFANVIDVSKQPGFTDGIKTKDFYATILSQSWAIEEKKELFDEI